MDNIQNIIKNVQDGNSIAERSLYKLLYVNLFKVARAYCADHDEATGVFNYAMVDIFRQLKPFTDETSLLKWSRRILVNDCIDHIRKKTVYQKKILIVADQESQSVKNEALDNLEMEELFTLINHLDTNARACFVMHVLEGYTHKEIAEKLKINVNTSKWYLAEAKKKIRKIVMQSYTEYGEY